MSLLSAYLIVIIGVLVWGVLLVARSRVSVGMLTAVSVFGGAFLLGSCFVNLVPHMFLAPEGQQFVVGRFHFKVAAAVMVGFLLQMLLEQLTGGIEHGHGHGEVSMVGLMIGLSLHALLEGMPLADIDGDVHQGLLYGIVLHNIPIAIILVAIFANKGYSLAQSMALLLLFAVMTPIGSMINQMLLSADDTLQRLIMGMVVGILLHVSVSILFALHGRADWRMVALIVVAFVAAYFTPGCPEIYPFVR